MRISLKLSVIVETFGFVHGIFVVCWIDFSLASVPLSIFPAEVGVSCVYFLHCFVWIVISRL